MKIKEIIDKYGDYEVKEEELEKILKEPKPKTVQKLERGDIYWYIHTDGDVLKTNWSDRIFDDELRKIGNIFLTKQEAEFERERRKIEAIMLKYGRRTFSHNNNYLIRMRVCDSEIYISDCTDYNYGMIYFDTVGLTQKAIDEIGKERLKKYYFRVEE